MQVFFQLRTVLAPCIEGLLLMDRLCFLLEQVGGMCPSPFMHLEFHLSKYCLVFFAKIFSNLSSYPDSNFKENTKCKSVYLF